MNNELTPETIPVQRIIWFAVAIALFILVSIFAVQVRTADPYIQEVLSIQGDTAKGHAIFQINCAACHGSHGNGHVGPSLHDVPKRKSKAGLIHQVVSGDTPPMPKFQPNPQQMADLLSYLEKF
ncbi:MAG: cytochrome c [Spirulinaceae cyanobacterium]